jgi:hypothetical protein
MASILAIGGSIGPSQTIISARSLPVERPIDYPLIAPLLDAELIKPCGQFQIPPCTVWPMY